MKIANRIGSWFLNIVGGDKVFCSECKHHDVTYGRGTNNLCKHPDKKKVKIIPDSPSERSFEQVLSNKVNSDRVNRYNTCKLYAAK